MAKLELLALKWAVIEKLWDYLSGSKLTVYTDNNPLAYVTESKSEATQIRWLSKFALFDSDIKYRRGKLNKAADALSHCPYVSEEVDSNSGSEEYENISYVIGCEELEEIIDGGKSPNNIRWLYRIKNTNLPNKNQNCTLM